MYVFTAGGAVGVRFQLTVLIQVGQSRGVASQITSNGKTFPDFLSAHTIEPNDCSLKSSQLEVFRCVYSSSILVSIVA
jgi:hypothetical protein